MGKFKYSGVKSPNGRLDDEILETTTVGGRLFSSVENIFLGNRGVPKETIYF